MADDEDTDLNPEEALLQRHRKERKQLQGEVTRLKHSVSKGDKKKKKEITAQIAKLEADLDAKHEQELKEFKDNQTVNDISNDVAAASITEPPSDEQPQGRKKVSKAQKRRDKKAEKAAERANEIAQAEIDNLQGARHIEETTLKSMLKQRGLKYHVIPSDGNCLYAALEDQLKRQGINSSVDSLRRQTASYMRQHPDDFLPFLCKPESGDMYTQDEFEGYCRKIENTAEWAGQLEIQALSNVLTAPIEVIQAEGPIIKTGEHYDREPLLLSYHRHMYGLGEHYNSVVPKSQDDSENEDEQLS